MGVFALDANPAKRIPDGDLFDCSRHHRRQGPPPRSPRLDRRQADPQRPEGRRRPLRAHQRFRLLLPQQVEVRGLPQQAPPRQPEAVGSVPLPRAVAHLLQGCPRYGPPQDARGAAALERLKVFEGVPPPYDRKKKVVVPSALRVLRLKPGRKYCTIKRISHEFGWSYRDVVDRLEEKRKVKAAAFHERKVATQKAQVAALKAATNAAPITEKLASYGY